MEWLKDALIYSILINVVAGIIGILSMQNMAWYNSLVKPVGTPPEYLFGIIWPILYVFIGTSYALIKGNQGRNTVVGNLKEDYAANLLLNFAWTPVFFLLEQTAAALIIIYALIWSTTFLIINTSKIDRNAAILLTPYLIWIMYAFYLNLGIFLLN